MTSNGSRKSIKKEAAHKRRFFFGEREKINVTTVPCCIFIIQGTKANVNGFDNLFTIYLQPNGLDKSAFPDYYLAC